MYPDRDTLGNVPRSGYITSRDQSMVESGLIEGGKNTASILFREWTQLLHNNRNILKREPKSNDFQSYPRRETAASGGKRCR